MNDTLIINGITYRAEKKEEGEKLSQVYISRPLLDMSDRCGSSYTLITREKNIDSDVLMTELPEGSLVLSREDIIDAHKDTFQHTIYIETFLFKLGFNK